MTEVGEDSVFDNESTDTQPSVGRFNEWQPIETAPEGEDIIGFFPDADTPVMIMHYLDFDDGEGGEWYEQNIDRCPDPLIVEPTHWMPLPPAPQTVAGTDATTSNTES